MQRLWVCVTLAIFVQLFGGCGYRQRPVSCNVPTPSQQENEFEWHIRHLGQDTPFEQARTSSSALWDAGVAAFPALVAHLDDKTIAAEQVRQVLGPDTVGQRCFDIVAGQIAPSLPKRYQRYMVLTPDNLGAWLEKHRGQSIVELRHAVLQDSIEAAQRSSDASAARAVEYLKKLQRDDPTTVPAAEPRTH
jgi:hypothetical protein